MCGINIKSIIMQKFLMTVIIIKFLLNICVAQTAIKEYNASDFNFIGTAFNKPVFRYIYSSYDKQGELPEAFYQWGLYFLERENNHYVFKVYDKNAFKHGRAYFVYDSINIFWDYKEPTQLKIIKQGYVFNIRHKDAIDQMPSFNRLSENKIVYSVFNNDSFLNVLTLGEKGLKTILPLIGGQPFVHKNYLYFGSNHIAEDKATPTPVDLYRVKIGDWNNPELLVEFISDGWLPLNDSIVLLTVPIKGRGKQVFYNIKRKTYASVKEELPTTKVLYEGKEYLLDNVKVGLDRRYKLTEMPKIPQTGYIKDNTREILPLAFHANLPNSQKRFENTFITEDLLYEASSAELQKLSNGQLRKLRNAFFARQGYQFNSNDLQDFFGQFGWYHEMVERNKFYELGNEQVVISPQDKNRVELILEVEQQKK